MTTGRINQVTTLHWDGESLTTRQKSGKKIYPTIFPCVDPPAPALSVFHGYLPEEPREFFRLERNVNRTRSLVRSRSETSDLNSSADRSILPSSLCIVFCYMLPEADVGITLTCGPWHHFKSRKCFNILIEFSKYQNVLTF